MKAYMKKLILASSILAAVSFAQLSQAAGNKAVINYKGNIVASTCSVVAGGGTADSLDFSMGDKPTDSFGAPGQKYKTLDVSVKCNSSGANGEVVFNFLPAEGSGPSPTDNRYLALEAGGAKGVHIELLDGDYKFIDLTANPKQVGKLTENADGSFTANMRLAAIYRKNGQTLEPGVANATLPFSMTHD